MGFEPTRAEHIGLAVQRLNHSATSSSLKEWLVWHRVVISCHAQRGRASPYVKKKKREGKKKIKKMLTLPCRELNPDLLGESQLS